MNTLFILLIGTFLIIFNIKGINKEKPNFKDTLDETKVTLPDYKLEIGQLRKEFAETVFELQSEIEKLKTQLGDRGGESSSKEKSENSAVENNENIFTIKEEESYKTINHFIDDEIVVDSIMIDEEDGEDEEFVTKDVKEHQVIDDNNTNGIDDGNERINDFKIQEVKKLIEAGKSIDEIAKMLNIGKGEVQLIKGFYLQ